MHAATLENSMAVPQKLKIELPYDPAILLLSIYPKEVKTNSNTYLHTHVHSSTIH